MRGGSSLAVSIMRITSQIKQARLRQPRVIVIALAAASAGSRALKKQCNAMQGVMS